MSLSKHDLIEKSKNFQESIHERHYASFAEHRRTAFLSHSHKDIDLIKGLIVWLQEEGIDLYIDWKDHSLPDVPSVETAKQIKNRIESFPLFLFLAIENSTSSRWCPWEIGYADSSKRKIYIISTSDYLHTYGSEYLNLYPCIDRGSDGQHAGFILVETGTRKGSWLSNVL